MKRILIASFLLLLSATCFAQDQDVIKIITVDGRVRQYLIHLPLGFDSAVTYPVVVALHPDNYDYESTVALYNLDPLSDRQHFIVIYPNAIGTYWSIPGISHPTNMGDLAIDDVNFINVMLVSMQADYRVDKKKVFATGMSLGGIFSIYLASKLSNRIKGVAAVCAS